MTESHGDDTQPVIAPPQTAGAIPRPQSTWPVVIGVIGLVFSIMAVIGGCWGMASPWVVEMFAKVIPDQEAAQLTSIRQLKYWIVGSSLLGSLVAVVLIVGSIGLIKRRRYSRRYVIAWAFLKIVFAIGAAVLAYVTQQNQIAAMKNESQMASAPAGLLDLLGIITAIVQFVWYSALPLFMLIWFWRPKIRAEMEVWK